MGNKKISLKQSSIQLLPNFKINIPTVGEVLKDEENYYMFCNFLTATPFQYMVQLDDLGIDFTEINTFEMFKILFPIYAKMDLHLLFGDLDLTDFRICENTEMKQLVLYSPKNKIVIDECVYNNLVDNILKINNFEKVKSKAGNLHAKDYLLEKERKRLKKLARKPKPFESYLEKMIVALVNTTEFPYNYDSCLDLSIYQFNQSYKQIQHKITFDNTMFGVYSGTIDTSKMKDKEHLSFIPSK